MKKSLIITLMVLGLVCMGYQISSADPIGGGVWVGWTLIDDDDDDDTLGRNDYIGPGYGGQYFDAEYLYYKYEYDESTPTLHVGVQTGFDIIDGKQDVADYSGDDYYAGDLALYFGSDAGTNTEPDFNYGIDFGFSFSPRHSSPGLYKVDTWNTPNSFPLSSPFTIANGTLVTGAGTTFDQGGDNTLSVATSFFQKVSFDISNIGIGVIADTKSFSFGAHWTMSCGNDEIEGIADIVTQGGGSNSVPEPATFVLMFLGLLGLVGFRRMKK